MMKWNKKQQVLDVYLAAYFLKTVINFTSSLPGPYVEFLWVRQNRPLNLYRALLHGRNILASQEKQGGLCCIHSHRGRREKSRASQLGKYNHSKPARIILTVEASSLPNSSGLRCTKSLKLSGRVSWRLWIVWLPTVTEADLHVCTGVSAATLAL